MTDQHDSRYPQDESPELTLLDQLERRQNRVIADLQALDARIQQLLGECQTGRDDRAA